MTVLLTVSFVETAATVKTVKITWSMQKKELKQSRFDNKSVTHAEFVELAFNF